MTLPALRYADLFTELHGAEELLARPINPTVISLSDWRTKRLTAILAALRAAEGLPQET
jgi:hypothetical protein